MSERFRGRWYGNTVRYEQRMPMQHTHPPMRGIPEPIARLAYEEYANQGNQEQSFERLHDRGGFSDVEIIGLLADLIERGRHRDIRRDTRQGGE